MKLDIHLVSWNRPKMTELVIRTIHRNTKPENYRLVVLDNGSEQPTQDMLQRLHEDGLIDELIQVKTNLGLEAARNLMLKNATESDYFICADNDCLPMPIKNNLDWTERLLVLIQDHEGYAAISCRTQVMIGTGNIFEEADELGDDLVDFPHPGGSLRIMDTKAVTRVGGWDREQAGRGAEERYICGKLNEAGYKTAFATRVKCLHLFGMTDTDNWGYDKSLKPQDTGHSPDVWHPVFASGDDIAEITKYAGQGLADDYSHHTA